MSTGYSGDGLMQRQRVCVKCSSFVTHEKGGDKQLACPLCGNKVEPPPIRTSRIDAAELTKIIAIQVQHKNAKRGPG